ncbi:MAG: hypothetical protein ACOYEV_02360 [Candidatus Nanopelagicales bacterium]
MTSTSPVCGLAKDYPDTIHRLFYLSSRAYEPALRGLLRELRSITAMEMVMVTMLDPRDESVQRAEFVDIAPGSSLQVPEGSSWRWSEGTCAAMHRAGVTTTADFLAEHPDHEPARLAGLRGFVSHPIHSADGGALLGTVCALDTAVTYLNADQLARVQLVTAAMSTVLVREAELGAARSRLADSHRRLEAHLAQVTELQDVSGNGIAVALSSIAALAEGHLDHPTRQRLLERSTRRLIKVQEGIDSLMADISVTLLAETSRVAVDLRRAWAQTGLGELRGGHGSLLILAHGASLQGFLRDSGDLLVPEVSLTAATAQLPIRDLSALSAQSRVHLRASHGRIEQAGRAHSDQVIAWDLAA